MRPLAPRTGVGIVLAGVMGALAGAQSGPGRLPLDHPAIQYANRAPDNPVSWLNTRLDQGLAALAFGDDGLGYLPSLLDELDVDADSQTLVFSRTSFQKALISRRTPRAIYFNDDVAVAFVPDGDLEVIATDPDLGVAFYTLAPGPQPSPRLGRPTHCLECHYAPATLGVPGLFVGSVAAAPGDAPEASGPLRVTDHRTPVRDRWGGWYLGRAGRAGTLGAAASPSALDAGGYLEPTSDPVALMVLEHQTQMINQLTRLSWETRIEKAGGLIGYGLAERMQRRVDEVLAYMLFVDEPPLDRSIEPVSAFARTFARRGPHDREGRSLRDVDLERRLFRYPLSYMIYSRAFDAIEPVVREFLLRRLYDVLTGEDPRPVYRGLDPGDRQAILTILRDTKPHLPAYWYDPDARPRP